MTTQRSRATVRSSQSTVDIISAAKGLRRAVSCEIALQARRTCLVMSVHGLLRRSSANKVSITARRHTRQSYSIRPSHFRSASSHLYRSYALSSHRLQQPSSSSSWLLAATACVSTTLACLYTSLVSCDAAAVSLDAIPASTTDTGSLTFVPSVSQPLSPLPQLTGSNEHDWQLVRQLQSALAQGDASLTREEEQYLRSRMSDPSTCFRYLLARGGDVQRAAQSIKHTARWRLNNQVDALTAASLVDKLTDSHMWLSEGIARDGTPLIINKKSSRAETDHERQFQLIVYTLERALRTLETRNSTPPTPPTAANPHPVPLSIASNQRWSWFLDLAAFSSGSSTPLSETRRIVDTLMNQYVERLNVAIILDAPRYFLCPPRTKHSHAPRLCCGFLSHTADSVALRCSMC